MKLIRKCGIQLPLVQVIKCIKLKINKHLINLTIVGNSHFFNYYYLYCKIELQLMNEFVSELMLALVCSVSATSDDTETSRQDFDPVSRISNIYWLA